MNNRITTKDLERAVLILNRVSRQAIEPYTRVTNSLGEVRFAHNIGNYHLDGAYGKVKLVQLVNGAGGTKNITGFTTKRELYNIISALVEYNVVRV